MKTQIKYFLKPSAIFSVKSNAAGTLCSVDNAMWTAPQPLSYYS